MMKHEFDELVGITTDEKCYERIEFVYMNSDKFSTKQEIADFYKKHDMNGIEEIYKQILEESKLTHFEVNIETKRHGFTFKCTTMYEALDALIDAEEIFGFSIDADDVMNKLVSMKNGSLVSCSAYHYSIAIRKGEV